MKCPTPRTPAKRVHTSTVRAKRRCVKKVPQPTILTSRGIKIEGNRAIAEGRDTLINHITCTKPWTNHEKTVLFYKLWPKPTSE